MARYIYQGTARDGTGAVISSATVSIVDAGTSTPSTVYAAETGGASVSSVTADSRGAFKFWVDTDDYSRLNAFFDLSVSKSNYSTGTKSKVSPEGFVDVQWDDIRMPLTQGKQGATTKPDFDYTNLGYLFPASDATEILYFIVQVPHGWKVGTDLKPHVHWQQMNSNVVVWKLDYKVIATNTATPAGFTTASGSTGAFTYSSGNLHQKTPLTDIDMSAISTVSTIILGQLYRDDAVDGGAGSNDALAWDIDFHFQVDALGSDAEFTK